jgi:hypothetical protein
MQDIARAAKDLFDLSPGKREFKVSITDDGAIVVDGTTVVLHPLCGE